MTEPEHATLADGTVLRDLTVRQLADLRWDATERRAYEVIATDEDPMDLGFMSLPPLIDQDGNPVTGNGS